MKKYFFTTLVLALTSLIVPVQSVLAQAQNPAIAKTSFNEVTSQLDPGGDFYMYLGTAQWLAHLSTKVEGWRQMVLNMPDAKPEDTTNINKAFDVVGHVIQDSGIQNLSGLGVSSVEVEPGLYRTKVLLHHYPEQGDGFLWKLCGGAPHPLTGLNLLPANTAMAMFSDADLPLVWSVVQDEVAKAGIPQAQDFMQQLPAQFEKSTKMNWDAFIHSLGGEFGLVLTLDDTYKVPIPTPNGLLQVPSPGLLLAIRVNDDTIFNCISDQLKSNQQVITVETNGLKMRIMPVPLPMAIDLRPTAASSGGYLFVATSDSLVQEVLAVKSGQKPGLKSTAEFKRLSQGIPDQGNQFYFVGSEFSKTIIDIQKQVAANTSQSGASAAQAQWIQSIFNNHPGYSYSVGANTPQGCLTVGNGSQSAAALALLPAIVVPGALAAIAIPNFEKARATSQENACINNLRQIDAAKQQWALEKNKTATDVPTEEDIAPYLMNNKMPRCPAGGTYTIGAVGEKPTCNIPGHMLPP